MFRKMGFPLKFDTGSTGPACGAALLGPSRRPDSGFYEVMNTEVTRCQIVSERLIVFEFENGIEMHLEDNSDQYESMQIRVKDPPSEWII